MTPETNRLAGAHREPGRGRNPILWRALLRGRDDHVIDGDVVSVRCQIARIEGIDLDFALSEILQHVGIGKPAHVARSAGGRMASSFGTPACTAAPDTFD